MTGTAYNTWETTAQMGTHKSDLQQISDNLTGEEGEEEQEHKNESFLVMVGSTAQMGTHKSDLQQISDNLTWEEGEEEQEHKSESFLVMVRSTAHRKDKQNT